MAIVMVAGAAAMVICRCFYLSVVLGLCFGVSLLAAKAGFSIDLGAFLIGAVIAETNQGHAIVTQMEPIRDMFTAIFFVTIGMLLDLAVIIKYAFMILVMAVITFFGKVLRQRPCFSAGDSFCDSDDPFDSLYY